MGKRILAIVVASVLALVGAVMVLLYARGADQRAVAAANPRVVYVSSLAIPAGTSIRDAVRQKMLTETQVPARGVPAGALSSVNDENSSLVALADVPPGQYVLANAFGDTPVGEKAIQVPAGKLAVSVQLSDPARVGTFVTPGSEITIFATYKIKRIDDSAESKVFNEQDVQGTSVLLENVQVIGMGADPLQGPAQGAGTPEEGEVAAPPTPSFLVTLAVTPEQATELVHAINQYELYAGLRGTELKITPNLSTSDLDIFRPAS